MAGGAEQVWEWICGFSEDGGGECGSVSLDGYVIVEEGDWGMGSMPVCGVPDCWLFLWASLPSSTLPTVSYCHTMCVIVCTSVCVCVWERKKEMQRAYIQLQYFWSMNDQSVTILLCFNAFQQLINLLQFNNFRDSSGSQHQRTAGFIVRTRGMGLWVLIVSSVGKLSVGTECSWTKRTPMTVFMNRIHILGH